MTVTVVEDVEAFREIINSAEWSAVELWAMWSGQCQLISPFFERFSSDPAFSHVKFYKVDVDISSEISQEVSVRAMPTFILYKAGNKIGEMIGASPAALKSLILRAVS